MVGFELQISGIGSGCFANRATTTAHFEQSSLHRQVVLNGLLLTYLCRDENKALVC